MKDTNSSEEEIDFNSIFRSLKKGFINIFQAIKGLINFSFQNVKTLIIFICIGIGISVGIYYIKKTVYVADLTIAHTRLNNNVCYTLINTLTKIRDNDDENNNYKILAEKLQINVEMAKQIKSISCMSLNENLEKNYKDSSLVLLPFKIEVKVYNASILDSLEKGILNYLESNEYATKRKKISENYLNNYEEKLKNEIIAIDSLKRIVDKSIIPRNTGNGIILGEPIDPVKVYKTGMDLYQSQLQIQEQRALNNSFEIIAGFPKGVIRDSNLLLNIFIGFVVSYIIGLLWAARKLNR